MRSGADAPRGHRHRVRRLQLPYPLRAHVPRARRVPGPRGSETGQARPRDALEDEHQGGRVLREGRFELELPSRSSGCEPSSDLGVCCSGRARTAARGTRGCAPPPREAATWRRSSGRARERMPVGLDDGVEAASGCDFSETLKCARALADRVFVAVDTCTAAASGHLRVLKYLRLNKCPWNSWTCAVAASRPLAPVKVPRARTDVRGTSGPAA